MKNKGFTLVELLAVIAILAILVIIALPNVMGMFNEAKKNSFTTELKQIYKTAEQERMLDSINNSDEKVYSRCSTCTSKQLMLSGRNNIDYYIRLDRGGNVVKFYATDGTYQYKYDGSGLLLTDITEAQTIAELDDSQIITIGEESSSLNTFYYHLSSGSINQSVPNGYTRYSSYQELLNNTGSRVFLKITEEGNIIKEAQIGFISNGNAYYLKKGTENITANEQVLTSLFGECNHDEYAVSCGGDHFFISLLNNGNIMVHDYSNLFVCEIYNGMNFGCNYSEPPM